MHLFEEAFKYKDMFERLPKHIDYSFKEEVIEFCEEVLKVEHKISNNLIKEYQGTESDFNAYIFPAIEIAAKISHGKDLVNNINGLLKFLPTDFQISNEKSVLIEGFCKDFNYKEYQSKLDRAYVCIAFFLSMDHELITNDFFQCLIDLGNGGKSYRDAAKLVKTVSSKSLSNQEIESIISTISSAPMKFCKYKTDKQLGVIYYEYLGGIVPDTRPFCEHRDGQFFHYKEILHWAEGKDAGGIVDLTNGTWQGAIQIDTIHSELIFAFTGGYGCRHDFAPVFRIKAIPSNVIERCIHLEQ